MSKISCSKCKKQITGIPNKLGGSVLCDECYPFHRAENGKLEFKTGREGSLTFGKYGFHNPRIK
jgi:hypothetical protein